MIETCITWVVVTSAVWLAVIWVIITRTTRERDRLVQAHEKARQSWIDELQKSPRGKKPEDDPSKRVLWCIGDTTEMDLGDSVYTLAKILDFEDDGTAKVLLEGGQLDDGDKKGFGYYYVDIDDLRRPRDQPKE